MVMIFHEEAQAYASQSRRFWKARFDDEVIRNEEMLRTKLAYIHNNPVKAGLVNQAEDYPYSSARAYFLADHSGLQVETAWCEVER